METNLTLTTQASSLTIASSSDMHAATSVVSLINQRLHDIKEEKERITKPLNEALKAERSRWKPEEDSLDAAVALLRSKMSDYQTQAVNMAKATPTLATGILEASDAPDLDAPSLAFEDKIATDQGTLSFRPTPTIRIIDPTIIPREYLVPNEALIMDALNRCADVPGAKIEIIQVPINRRAKK